MPLTEKEAEDLKNQLREQVQNLPEPKKSQALAQIEALSPEALESMVAQQQSEEKEQRSPFRLIVERKIPAEIIAENSNAIAVLEINPISKAHLIIISKIPAKDAKDLSIQALALAKKLSKRIISKLKAKSAEIQTENKFGEVIINLIPIYDTPLNINSQRYKASKEELEQISQKIKVKARKKIEKIKIEKKESQAEPLKLKRKIPSY